MPVLNKEKIKLNRMNLHSISFEITLHLLGKPFCDVLHVLGTLIHLYALNVMKMEGNEPFVSQLHNTLYTESTIMRHGKMKFPFDLALHRTSISSLKLLMYEPNS